MKVWICVLKEKIEIKQEVVFTKKSSKSHLVKICLNDSEIERQLRIECRRRSIAHISQELIMEVIAEEGQRVSTELIQMETAQRDQRLAEIEKAILLGQQAKYLQR